MKARYRLLDLLSAQRNDRLMSNLKVCIENVSTDKSDLEEISYKILIRFYMKKKGFVVPEIRQDRCQQAQKRRQIPLQIHTDALLFRSDGSSGRGQGVQPDTEAV